MTIVKFGGTPKEQTELASLVISGEKVATSSLVILKELFNKLETQINDIWSIHDGEDKECCQVIVSNVTIRSFGEIDETFAQEEGDGNFENWYSIHFNYYQSLLAQHQMSLTDETLLECVYFRKI